MIYENTVETGGSIQHCNVFGSCKIQALIGNYYLEIRNWDTWISNFIIKHVENRKIL